MFPNLYLCNGMNDFAAIDFETANEYRTSICSVGVVIVKERTIVDSFYSLVRPEPEYYRYFNTQIHGITMEDTANAPVFPNVWKLVEPLIERLPLIAHNKAFDESCLKSVFRMYRMDYPIMLSFVRFSNHARFLKTNCPISGSIPLLPIADST